MDGQGGVRGVTATNAGHRHADEHSNQGRRPVHCRSRSPAAGVGVARAAKAVAPQDPDLADTFGWLLHRSGDHVLALRETEIAVKSNPSNSHFLFHRGEVLLAFGMRAQAREAFEGVVRLDEAYARSKGVPERLARIAKDSGR